MKKNHLGSTLDDFLKEDRLLYAVQATDKNTVKRGVSCHCTKCGHLPLKAISPLE